MTEQGERAGQQERYYVKQEIVRDSRGRAIFRPWTVFDAVQVVPGFLTREKSFVREDEARALAQHLNRAQQA